MARAKQTVFKLGTVPITGMVGDLAWNGRTWSMEDTTSYSAAVVTEQLPTIRTDGPVTFNILFDVANTEHNSLRALNVSGALQDFILVQVDGETDLFNQCVVSAMKPLTPVKGLMKYEVTIMPTGEVPID